MTDFRNKIKSIRSDQEEITRDRVRLTDEELGLNDGVEERLLAHDKLTSHVEQLMRDFITETPSFAISHGFFEGKYSLSMSCDELCKDQRGEVDKCFSRVTFLLAPKADNTMEVVGKMTILNRDLPKDAVSGPLLNEEDQKPFCDFAEDQVLRFAKEYFAARRLNPKEPMVHAP